LENNGHYVVTNLFYHFANYGDRFDSLILQEIRFDRGVESMPSDTEISIVVIFKTFENFDAVVIIKMELSLLGAIANIIN